MRKEMMRCSWLAVAALSLVFFGVAVAKQQNASGSAQAIINLAWDTSERSQVLVTVDTSGNINGTVTRGKFAGETVSASLTITPLNGDCVFTPVTKASATGTVAL